MQLKHLDVWSILVVCALAGTAVQAAEVDFNREIQPILSDNCYQCHGPDAKARKAGLRLDTKEGAFRVRDGLTAIVPKDSGNSELVKRISSTDPDFMMPPPASNHKLTQQQIATLKRWIDEGAKWGQHWAYIPLGHPAVPTGTSPVARHPIDGFVRSRLEKEGLKPS